MSSRDTNRRPGGALPLVGDERGAEYLAGQVERITYHDPESGFCVLRVALRDRREPATLVGHAALVAVGEHLHATGAWVQDRTHGQQFKATWIRVSPPDSPEGIERYLGSGLIKGIGPHLAKQLVDAFGTGVFDVIDREPDRLLDIAGIGRVRARRIVENWQGQRAVREIMVFLHAHGISTSRAVRIHRTYGTDAVKVLTEDPYRLARDIRGIGFLTPIASRNRLACLPMPWGADVAPCSTYSRRPSIRGIARCPPPTCASARPTLVGLAPALIDDAIVVEVEAGTVVATTIDGDTGARPRVARRLRARGGGAAREPGRPPPSLAGHRRRTRDPVGRRQAVAGTLPESAGGRRQCPRHAGDGADRWPGRRQDHGVASHPWHPHGQGRPSPACRAHGPGRQAHDRGDGPRGQDHPSPARDQPAGRAFPPSSGPPARGRPAGGRRVVDGRCRADGAPAAGGARFDGPAARGRRRPTAVGRPRAGAGRRDRLGPRARGATHGNSPPVGREPHRAGGARDQCRPDAGVQPGGAGRLLLRGRRGCRSRAAEAVAGGGGTHPAALRSRSGA